ncbi:MAG TPA: DUF2750 domain-containing protein [Marinagarivorans sp.]
MNKDDFDYISQLEGVERYECFLDLVAEARELWILVNENNEFLKVNADDTAQEVVPVWPHEDFAKAYAAANSDGLIAMGIALPQFFMKWVPGLEQDGLSVGVFPGPDADIWIMPPSELKADLQDSFS